jgi:two-component system osmolarity sensor histidine kinase EnvZ
VRLWPRSLFGRLALLLLLVILISQATSIFLFRQDRAALLARQFSDTKIVQLQSLRTALSRADPATLDSTLAQFERDYEARIVLGDPPFLSRVPPPGLAFEELGNRLKEALGPDTEIRVQPRAQVIWIRLQAGEHPFWAGFRLPRPTDNAPSRALEWSLIALAVLLVSAYGFARWLARPLRQLNQAVARVGEGQSPPPLPETGPSEIVSLNRGFNHMLTSLRQAEEDRALLLAGVSHDLRTPLARLRLGIEVGAHDARDRAAMVADIEEMDKIIGQFLDFARGDAGDAPVSAALDPVVAGVVERYRRNNGEIRFQPGNVPPIPLHATAMSRLVANLVDNALRYGKPPVDVSTRVQGNEVVLEVADRGPGIVPQDIERLKRPFTRGESARTGATGAGLGLAIVERVARLHGGRFDLIPREGGGTLARVYLPRSGPVPAP